MDERTSKLGLYEKENKNLIYKIIYYWGQRDEDVEVSKLIRLEETIISGESGQRCKNA